ncbi:MAG: type I restriction endonuclease subunit R [Gammaproteobacteria bacterium]|nr:type I restriction endonuclease subunit R [Gammaproteobacteria bacterium]
MQLTQEQKIERGLIEKLRSLGYHYNRKIIDQDSLNANFRQQFNALNQVNLADSEFKRLMGSIIKPDVFAVAQTLRGRNSFERDDGTPLNYTLVNIKNWCKNRFEVISQLRINTTNSHHRYDVILLINGIPVMQIELKTLGVNPRRAMKQIVDYKNDVGNGYTKTLLAFIQLFAVSNQSDTLYFTNNNNQHFNFDAEEHFLPFYRFASEDNKKITQLDKFADKFLAKCTLAEMISRYMVLLAGEQKLLMMRPYQIYAVHSIVDCVNKNDGNGYIWHTTGSGKTLTSFKASTLLKENKTVEKCLFVVDRKDLDKQTREEFNKFQQGCVEENTNTYNLVQRLISQDYADKVIVTTIQKLGLALDETNKNNYKKELAPLADKKIVFIFDECHRSQFGKNHESIKTFFPNSQLFGFTGTPIFEENASYTTVEDEEKTLTTTQDIFQKELHNYTITHAIDDNNVLRFHIDHFKTDNQPKSNRATSQKAVVTAILDKHHSATNGRKFNAILASKSINHAIEYHRLFKELQDKKQQDDDTFPPLNIACVFSPPADNIDTKQIQEDLEQEKADNKKNPDEKKQALKAIIKDYNQQYGTSHHINNFDGYYQDIQQRIKDQQYLNQDYPQDKKIDITIVVDMLLTGFDSKYLNTLYIDKNLKYHGLIQAFSRTNRVLNDTKPYGNIIDFTIGTDKVDSAIALFSGEDKEKSKEIWLVDSAPIVIKKLAQAVEDLDQFMHAQELENTPENVNNLKGDEARAGFIEYFKKVQRLKTQIKQYTDLKDSDKQDIENIIPEDTFRAFKGAYLDTAKGLKAKQGGNENLPEVENLDFEFVLFTTTVVDYDYIMRLIAKYTQDNTKYKITKEQLISLIASDAKFMDEIEDIKGYIETLEMHTGLDEKAIKQGYKTFKENKSATTLDDIAQRHNIKEVELKNFTQTTLKRKIFDGDLFSDLFTHLNLGWKARADKETKLAQELIPLLDKQAEGEEISGMSAYES